MFHFSLYIQHICHVKKMVHHEYIRLVWYWPRVKSVICNISSRTATFDNVDKRFKGVIKGNVNFCTRDLYNCLSKINANLIQHRLTTESVYILVCVHIVYEVNCMSSRRVRSLSNTLIALQIHPPNTLTLQLCPAVNRRNNLLQCAWLCTLGKRATRASFRIDHCLCIIISTTLYSCITQLQQT